MRGHGKVIFAVMALVMATMACSIQMGGVSPPPPSMTVMPTSYPSMTATQSGYCYIVHSMTNGDGNLNLRSGPGENYPVITVVHDGQYLVMDDVNGEWLAVRVVMDGRVVSGFVHSSYVEACP